MIRLFYWIIALIEILLILSTILLFIITDSRTVHIFGKDILKEYGISYKRISGNLFTGIKVSSLKYNNKKLVESITIYWNPFALSHKKVNITKLELKGVELEGVFNVMKMLPTADNKNEKPNLLFDLNINKINLEVNPFVYHGVEFKNFYFEMLNLVVDRDIEVNSELISFSLDSDLVDLSLKGIVTKNSLKLNRLELLDIDPKVITSFLQSIKKEQKKQNNKKESNSSSAVAMGAITIDNFFATMRKTTYDPVTIDKTKIIAKNLYIDPNSGFSYSASSASISTDTNFASTKQIGYIKDSMFYGAGDIITKKYLYNNYSLPLNQEMLKTIYAKLQVNHKGVWVEIEQREINNLLTLDNSDFNVNLKRVKHKFDYLYNDFFIEISSKGVGSFSYADEINIDNRVDIDFSGEGDTEVVYSGKLNLDSIKNIPNEVSETLLEKLTVEYRGTPDELLVKADSKQIEAVFFTDNYKNAKLKIETKESIALDNLLQGVPKDSFGYIQSDSYIEFFDSDKTRIDVDIDSNLINLKTSMGIIQPLQIEFTASIPKSSKILDIDNRIRVKNISNINGKVILNKNDIATISLSSDDLKLFCYYDIGSNRFSSGKFKIANEKIMFDGSFNKGIKIESHIKNMSRFSKAINRYYDIKLAKMSGNLNINIKINGDSTIDIYAKSKSIGYMDFRGDIDATVNINKNRLIDIEFKSKKLSYDDIKFHALSGKLSIFENDIEIDRYSFKLYNDYISHFYTEKNSYLRYKDGFIYVDEFWIKDRAFVFGKYHIESLKGEFNLSSDSFSFKNSDLDLISRYKLKLKLDKKRVFIDGTINPFGNKITYEAVGSGISQDNDIVIVQEQREREKSALNDIKLKVTIENDKPLKYITDDINIEFTNSVILIKDYNREFKLIGTTTINSGYYQQDDKRFHLNESHLYFSGDPKKPLLEIKATYVKEQYNIQIFISGTTDDPIINFNSDPYLTQKEILSLILFDSTGSGNRSGTELYALLGGTFAKELMKSLGVSVDHLLLGQGIDERLSVEIGEKISDNITVIYQHNNGKNGVKVRVDHSDSFETDIILQPPNSSSMEFLYKSD